MNDSGGREIVRDGLWSNNTGLVALLGLCPLLAVSNSAINALGLGVATVLVLTLTNLAVSLLRRFASDEMRIPAYIVVIAATVTCVELAMNAWLHEMYRVLGIFIPLIV
ncbi:MAG: Rnf-Nqr domain containing protein, partial [Pseudomonadota bacterium]